VQANAFCFLFCFTQPHPDSFRPTIKTIHLTPRKQYFIPWRLCACLWAIFAGINKASKIEIVKKVLSNTKLEYEKKKDQ